MIKRPIFSHRDAWPLLNLVLHRRLTPVNHPPPTLSRPQPQCIRLFARGGDFQRMAQSPSPTPAAASTASPTPPIIRVVEIGTMRNDIRTTDLNCGDGTFVTRLDMQTVIHTYYGGPYIAGLRLYCAGHSSGEFQHSVNWSPASVDGQASFTNFEGGSMADGIRHVVAAWRVYVELFGYGSSTIVGGGNGARTLWQQATHRDFADCRLQGIEAIWYSWIDGMRLRYSCTSAPPLSTSTLLPSEPTYSPIPSSPSIVVVGETCPVLVPVGIGVAVGIIFASTIILAWRFVHERWSRSRRKSKVDQEPLVPLLPISPTFLTRATIGAASFIPSPLVTPYVVAHAAESHSAAPAQDDGEQDELFLPQTSSF